MTTPLVLDTDIGGDVDDALALAFCALHPGIDLRAVTTVNGGGRRRAGVAAALLERCGRADVPVAIGAERPAGGRGNDWMPSLPFDESTGMAVADRDFGTAAELIAAVVSESDQPVAIACIGPVTNVAALLHERPELIDNVSAVHVMGGCLAPYGIDRSTADFNFGCDPASVSLLLSLPVAIRMMPIDVTWTLAFDDDDRAAVARAGPVGAELRLQMDLWLAAHPGRHREPPQVRLHDPATVVRLADPSVERAEMLPISFTGRPTDVRTQTGPHGRPVSVVRHVDAGRLRSLLVDTITRDR